MNPVNEIEKKERKEIPPDDHENREGHRSRLGWHNVRVGLLIVYDLLFVNLSYFLALWLRFDCRFSMIDEPYLEAWLHFIPFYSVVCLIVFGLLKLYTSLWQFASYTELYRIVLAGGITAVIHILGISLFFHRMPVSYYLVGPLLQFFFLMLIRFSYRFVMLLVTINSSRKDGEAARVMMIGAGSSGRMILRDIRYSENVSDQVVCLIDDDPSKWGRSIEGVPVVGGRDEIMAAAEKYRIEKIYLAIPSATPQQKRDLLNICSETGCELKQLPGMYQFVTGQLRASGLRKVTVEDLLGRDPIRPDLTEVYRFLKGKVILVTGGGGSIGSELCRQIASHEPKKLIILDIYENNAYDIQLELKEKYPDLDLLVLIGSVRDSRRMISVFEEHRPQIVFHAAAHKHVPLMEDSPCEAVKNNAIGTYKTAYAAMLTGVEKFVLVSTDKAVNPTNVMGATKRLCEMVVQSFDNRIREKKVEDVSMLFTHHYSESNNDLDRIRLNAENIRTEFVAVRFGNVLGSNGSVVPLFRKQIEKGGPVTVTHPDIIRYFMTIPEAVSLLLTAALMAEGGQIFVLDMGEPVKIADLARNMIRMYGLKPDQDIQIEYTGLRPGEKLYEEKLMAEEGLKKTENNLIFIGSPIPFDTDQFLSQMEILMKIAYSNDPEISRYIEGMVSTYHPAQVERINEKLEKDKS
ncbi:MAG: polysaccharide biosynthesis protein [Firmicutes bacterium]|nr:polysaccharide biosynthesis protein [Bacillota bacterium]